MNYFWIFLGSILYAEFVGYFLHKAIHSEKVAWLSKYHMYHHLRDYSPRNKMRTESYISGSKNRFHILGFGMEWVIPSAAILAALVGILTLIGLPWYQQMFSSGVAILWSGFMFGYMHSRMHEKSFWMLKVPVLRDWFKLARRLHDIHHIHISPDGKMNRNYGICFFFMDRLFGTYITKAGRSKEGYNKALERYSGVV